MKLTDLDASFVGEVNPADGSHRVLPSVQGAQGVLFQCPKCANGKEVFRGTDNISGVIGAHYVLCWFQNPRNAPTVPLALRPATARWHFTGDSIGTLTLSPAIELRGGCRWLGEVKNGEIK